MCIYELLLNRLEVYVKLAKESKCSKYKKYYDKFFPQSRAFVSIVMFNCHCRLNI